MMCVGVLRGDAAKHIISCCVGNGYRSYNAERVSQQRTYGTIAPNTIYLYMRYAHFTGTNGRKQAMEMMWKAYEMKKIEKSNKRNKSIECVRRAHEKLLEFFLKLIAVVLNVFSSEWLILAGQKNAKTLCFVYALTIP